MSAPANPSNRPNTIDIQLINKNLSEKMNAIRNTGKVDEAEMREQAVAAETMAIGKEAEQMQNKSKNSSIFKICKYPILLFILYTLIHNKYAFILLNKIKFINNLQNPFIKNLIKGLILVTLFNLTKLII
jgi:hypothetical protein